MKKLILLLPFILIFLGFFHPIFAINQDLGRHIITGNIILKTHQVPKTNLFSYTFPNHPFVNHHWLSEVIYAILYSTAGINSLLILNIILVLLSFGLIISFIYKKINPYIILFCSFLYLPILFERTDVRPEFFSFLFLSLFIVILYKFKEKFTRLIFLLPLIELCWVNVHIYFPIGIVVILFFFFDYLVFKKFKIDKNILIFGSITALTCLATLINPNGLRGALYPLNVFQNYGYSIEENQNIFFLWDFSHRQSIVFFFIGASIFWLSLLLNFKKTFLVEWLLAVFFTIFAATSIRNFPLFAFATLIPLIKTLSNIKFSFPKQIKTFFFLSLLGLFIFQSLQIINKNGLGLDKISSAKEGVDFFLKQKLQGPIFNNFDIGSYLDFRIYPNQKVFIDGRPEAYPASFIQNIYIPMQTDKNKFDLIDKQYHFQTIFFSHTDQTPWAETFLKQISQNRSWHLVYLDDFTVIYTKNKNIKSLIKTDYSNFNSLIQLAHFFQNKNFDDQEIKVYQKILSLKPNFCPAIYNLAIKLQQNNDPSFQIFASKFQQNCK